MARKVGKRDSRYLAKIVTEDRAPCAFCRREVDNEITYGKLYAIGQIQCHYFCALLSCCLVQKGPEEEGLFGFMYKDILTELERSKKHKCSYCGHKGANLGCSVGACRKQFHLPCGRERNAVSLYYGSYKSFCQTHAPKQSIPEHIMSRVRMRNKGGKKTKEEFTEKSDKANQSTDEEMVCVICYEAVEARPTVSTFWPPCCARDAWFHRSCVQRMALSAGMHYLKCPLCNDKQHFYDAVVSQGYYVPDRDAAWELEQNAFAEIYERPLTCSAERCQCAMGRDHDGDQGMWDMKLCLLCGSVAAHAHCAGVSETTRYVCLTCTPAAPRDLRALADTIDKMIVEEQANSANATRHGPVMPSRMSLRRTKGRLAIPNAASCSRARVVKTECESAVDSPNLQSSRLELNLKTPRRLQTDSYNPASPRRPPIHTSYNTEHMHSPIKLINQSLNDSYNHTESYKKVEAMMLSPMRLVEQSFRDKVVCMGVKDAKLDESVLEMLRRRFRKPRPLSEKKKLVDDILNGLFDNSETLELKEPVREQSSPTTCYTIQQNENQTASENSPKDTENTVENKENQTQETPNKIVRIKQNFTTPNQIQETPKSSKFDCTYETNENVKWENNSVGIEDNCNDIEGANNETSNSTFELHPEFVADTLSDDSFMGFQTPKRKTIDIKQDSSLEISEQDHSVSIVIENDDSKQSDDPKSVTDKTPKKKRVFKFSPLDKENLVDNNIGTDLETFKKEYLNEVDKEFKCCFNHKHNHSTNNTCLDKTNFRTVIDFAIDAHLQKEMTDDNNVKKRKLSEGSLVLSFDKEQAKKRKISENDLNLSFSNSSDEFKIKNEFISPAKELIEKKDEENKGKGLSDKSKRKIKRNKDKRRLRKIRERHVKDRNLKDKIRSDKNRKLKDEDKNMRDRKLESEQRRMKETRSERRVKDNILDTGEKSLKNKIRDEKINKRKVKHDKYAKNKKQDNERRDKDDHDIEVTIDSSESKSKNKTKKNKQKTKLSIRNNAKDISVKIKWKKKRLRLKIESKNKTEKVEEVSKLKADSCKFNQYVLQYFSEMTPKEVLVKPQKEVSPLKRKYVRHEKNADKYKQMSIQNFFKVQSPN